MSKTVDARGLACPQPVILTRRALEQADSVVIIVDSDTAQHNVRRMAEQAGYQVETEVKGDGTYLHITSGEAPEAAPAAQETAVPAGGPIVLVVAGERMGRGEHDELGGVLIRSFFHTLGEVAPTPDIVIFYNSGVKLVVKGSPVLDDLCSLAERGVQILACGTCLNYYQLLDQVAVGEVSNMYTIAETMLQAGKVVNL